MTTCPSCGSNRIHRSRSRGFGERLRRQFSHKRVFRCSACGWRGWGIDTGSPTSADDLHTAEAEPVNLDEIDRTLEEQGSGLGDRGTVVEVPSPHR